VIFSLALGTALREHEILALDVGDVFDDADKVRRRVYLRVFKGCNEDSAPEEVILPDALRAKLDKFHGWKRVHAR
jgi:integrase